MDSRNRCVRNPFASGVDRSSSPASRVVSASLQLPEVHVVKQDCKTAKGLHDATIIALGSAFPLGREWRRSQEITPVHIVSGILDYHELDTA